MMSLGLVAAPAMARSFDNAPVSVLNADRYLGRWFEIARFNHSFEKGIDYATAYYTLKPDGTLRVVNSGIKDGKPKSSVGKAKFTGLSGLLRVSFFGPFYSDYRVLMVSDDYSYALVGSGSPKYLWVLSRTPRLPDGVLKSIMAEAKRRGYDTNKLIWVVQDKDGN